MPRPTDTRPWLLLLVALVIIAAWPPRGDRSLAVRLVNWAADPLDSLPVLPGPLPLGQGDDPEAVYWHDLETEQYDALYRKGGWTRLRLRLKVTRDPIPPAAARQLLLALAVVTAFLAWRSRRRP